MIILYIAAALYLVGAMFMFFYAQVEIATRLKMTAAWPLVLIAMLFGNIQ